MKVLSFFSSRVAKSQRAGTVKQRRRRRLLCESLEQRALLAGVVGVPIVVDNLNDSGDGSLRAAVAEANATSGADVIQFDFESGGPYAITLTSGELLITDDLTIEGLGSAGLTISGNDNSRIFNVVEPADNPDEFIFIDIFVSIQGLTLTDGSAVDGGAIRNESATLYLTDVTVTGNSATGKGGGIYTLGEDFGGYGGGETTLIINDSQITSNQGGLGGGIYNDKDHVKLYGSVVSDNTATGNGGGIYTLGQTGGGYGPTLETLIINDSQVTGNQAVNGGGIYNEIDHVELFNTVVSDNTATGNGGGIYTLGQIGGGGYGPELATLIVNDSQISGNNATGSGGGIYNQDDHVGLFRSTVVGNIATRGRRRDLHAGDSSPT